MTAKTSLATSLFFSLIVYILLGYCTNRANFDQLIVLYFLAFVFYGISIYFIKQSGSFLIPIAAGIIFRIALLFCIPDLSDDFYRFIWDGRLSMQGINVFQYLPSELVGQSIANVDTELFEKLNSQHYYSVYPPINQLVYFISALIFPKGILGSIFIMKSFILLFEIGSIYIMYQLLQHFLLRKELIFLYILNPLIIVELTGNIHFEAAMIFFSLLAVYFSIKNKIALSGIALSMSIATKLWPLVFIPFFLRRLGFRNFLVFGSAVLVTLLLLFLPFWTHDFAANISSSLSLYFQHFEFNGSLYYLVRMADYELIGFNVAQAMGICFPVIAGLLIVLMLLWEKGENWQSIFTAFLFALTIYFLFATTVHPWYLTPLIAFSIFTPLKYPILWSFLIPMTYITYQVIPYEENQLLVLVEYILTGLFLVYEIAKMLKVKYSVS